eukprot:TRINITY_DN1993_c1_g4_i1.p1 TRINITY_DN1993_c1_g4~~TRINITY_DN1993_c1_g4_i1.p1  ORF type:complete len:596 (-),score=93.80 TRINITY_DN1993_c1_g4_i1:263-2050(-)
MAPYVSSSMVPDGVNLGGWFCLEDWFYSAASGPHAGHHVNTDEPRYDSSAKRIETDDFVASVSKILPLTSDEVARLPRERFGCETDLVNLLLSANISEARVVELFWQHRRSYITPLDFARIRSFGIRRVRLPLTWCLSYDTPYVIMGKDRSGQDRSAVIRPGARIVEDPFTNDPAFDPAGMRSPSDKWVSIPIRAVEVVLETAANYGIEVLLDIHAFPGGAAAGTFNGVWPLNPRFWSAHYEENMRTIIRQLLDWIEALPGTNPRAYRGLYGVTPMNEPAHIRGLVQVHGLSTYELNGESTWASRITTAQVLKTLAIALNEFRSRPRLVRDKRLLMNVIETAWPQLFGGQSGDSKVFGASQKDGIEAVYDDIGAWWRSVTTEDDRLTWAVLDIHNYIAWGGDVPKLREVQTQDEFRAIVEGMSLPFFQMLRQRLAIPKPQLLACSEYSASTDRDTFLSTTSGVGSRPPRFFGFNWQRLRDLFLVSQHKAARESEIQMWFWTYHIRMNVNYQGEWSLQHILSPWPRLRRWLANGLPALSDFGGIFGAIFQCFTQSGTMAAMLLWASAQAPVQSLWLQRFGFQFEFQRLVQSLSAEL